MGQVNIYKIAINKNSEFLKDLAEKMDEIGSLKMEKEYIDIEQQKETLGSSSEVIETNILDDCTSDKVKKEIFELTLYVSSPKVQKEIPWNWILNAFKQDMKTTLPNPKAVLLVRYRNEYYSVTFGLSYFLVDKYCDRNFAFNFARKLDYKEVKTTALTTPNSQRNKSINTYVNYNDFEFDSGESFTKIKAKVDLDTDFSLFKEGIEVGNSIKFNIINDSLNSIVDLIHYIENVLLNIEDKVKIPVYSKILEDDLIQKLEQKLESEIKGGKYLINFSEIDIIGANEVFNHNDSYFKIYFKTFNKTIDELTHLELQKFADENKFILNENILNIKVVSFNNGNPIRTDYIKSLIEFTDDEERCLLSKGQWFKFNDDYLNYLADSIKEIETIYDPKYDFKKSDHEEFIGKKYNVEKEEEIYKGLTEKQIKDKLKRKYYSEKYYNINLQEKHEFTNYDRELTKVGTAKVEEMDSYKDGAIFAVKIGNSSGKLSYVVDQSLQTLKIYKHKMSDNQNEVKEIGLWIILERKTKLTLEGNKPDLNELDMLILKNKIDYWKKEVRLGGYKPIIRINYVI